MSGAAEYVNGENGVPQDPPNVYHPIPESTPAYEGYADPAAAHGRQNAGDGRRGGGGPFPPQRSRRGRCRPGPPPHREVLRRHGADVLSADNGRTGGRILGTRPVDLLISDTTELFRHIHAACAEIRQRRS